jgi:hypothetical protein
MKLNTIAAAALTLGLALSAQAATYGVTTDSFANSTGGGVGADVGLSLTSGESFTVSTDASQIWHGAAVGDGNYDLLTSNANGTGTTAYATWLPGIGTTDVGTLVADIDGDYRVIGAGTTTFSAWESGELFFHYADINFGDNSGSVFSTVTTASAVPEPANMALLMAGLGMMGLVARRRASSQK